MKLHHSVSKKIALMLVITLLMICVTIPANAATYTYDKLNRLTSVTYGNGLKLTYAYDAGGNITSVSHTGGQQSLSVKSTVPADKATDVPVDQSISVTFSVYVQPGIAYDSISVQDATYNPVNITKSITAATLTIDPVDNLAYDTLYTVTIPAGAIKDTASNELTSNYIFSFTTGCVQDTTAPTISGTDPANSATDVAVDKTIGITFTETVVESVYFEDISFTDGNIVVSYIYTLTDTILTLDPVNNLAYNTTYTVTVPAGAVADAASNVLADDYVFSFTTAAEPDMTPPMVTSTAPPNGSNNVARNKIITMVFSENVQAGLAYEAIKVTNTKNGTVHAVTRVINGNMLTLTPIGSFDSRTLYEVFIPAGSVADTAGNSLEVDYIFNFTTSNK